MPSVFSLKTELSSECFIVETFPCSKNVCCCSSFLAYEAPPYVFNSKSLYKGILGFNEVKCFETKLNLSQLAAKALEFKTCRLIMGYNVCLCARFPGSPISTPSHSPLSRTPTSTPVHMKASPSVNNPYLISDKPGQVISMTTPTTGIPLT